MGGFVSYVEEIDKYIQRYDWEASVNDSLFDLCGRVMSKRFVQ